MSILKTKVKVMLFTKASQQDTNENISNENNGNKKNVLFSENRQTWNYGQESVP